LREQWKTDPKMLAVFWLENQKVKGLYESWLLNILVIHTPGWMVVDNPSVASASVKRPAAADTHSAPIAHAGELLLKAAETGKGADIEAATDQIERVLRSNRIIG
jgi:hypothetical protein